MQKKEKQQHKNWKLYKPPPKEDYSGNFKKLIIVIIISFVFIAGEFIGGIISHSISVISDAFHLVTDLLGFVVSFVFIWFSRKKPTRKMTFGYHRMELMGALGNLFIIWALAFFLIYQASVRIINKEFVKQPLAMLIVAAAGLPVNIVMYFVLHSGGSHSHGLMAEGCGEEFPLDNVEKQDSICGELMCEDIECLMSNQYVEHCHKNESIHKHGDKVLVDGNRIIKKNESALLQDNNSFNNINEGDMEMKPKNKCTHDHSHDGHNHDGHNHDGHNHDHKHDHKHDHDHDGHNHDGHKHDGHNHDGHKHDHSGHHHDHDHDHDHDHGHHHHESMSMKAAVLHALSDIIQSIGLLISALIIFFVGSKMGHTVTEFNNWHYLDPISTYIFSLIVIFSTWPITKNCYQIIMESAPENINTTELQNTFTTIQGIVDVHDLHVWDLRPGKTILIAHVFAVKGRERDVLMKLTEICRKKRIYHSTFQVEEVDLKNTDEYILCDHDIH